MMEIIPNWHPIFVHFTVALFSTSVGFYGLAYFAQGLNPAKFKSPLLSELETVARWCLWMAALVTLGTLLLGFYAYYTVNHDSPSHVAMTSHRNWAIPTLIAMLGVAFWSMWRYSVRKTVTLPFLIVLLLVQGLLLSTAWRGAELVFRYGLGVLSLPQFEGVGHQHQHDEAIKTGNPLPASSTTTHQHAN